MNLNNQRCITKEGFFDPGKLPMEPILRQAIGNEEKEIHGAIRTLALMRSHGRKEAGIFLMGLAATAAVLWWDNRTPQLFGDLSRSLPCQSIPMNSRNSTMLPGRA
jgi:hypothetical protein